MWLVVVDMQYYPSVGVFEDREQAQKKYDEELSHREWYNGYPATIYMVEVHQSESLP